MLRQAGDPEAAILVADLSADAGGPELSELALRGLLARIVFERLQAESEDLGREIREAEDSGDHGRAQTCLARKLEVDRQRKQMSIL